MEHDLEIFLVRHGETNWNAGYAVDKSELQNLTARAERQIINAAEILRAEVGDAEVVYASMEHRAIQSARLIIENGFSALSLLQTPLINERDYGSQQSIAAPVAVGGNHTPYRYADYAKLSAEEKWIWKPFPDFESDEEIRQRFLKFIEMVQESDYRRVIAVSHGGFIRVALMHSALINHRDWENFAIANGDVFKLKINNIKIKAQVLSSVA